MVLLRPRLQCHYCGGRCHVKKREERRFKCEHCQAVNFLDENGEIADVPPEEAAHPEEVLGPSSVGSTFENSVFCATCAKNQYLYNEALSKYLPEPEDPRCVEIEAALPQYRKKLEERYPQVCAKCEPKVREQLHQATYTAKSDHVRRMLERSRARRIANRWGWRSIVVQCGRLGYWSSITGQLLWHAMGALSSHQLADNTGFLQCLRQLFTIQNVSPDCVDNFAYLAGHSLVLGMLFIWWNPKWLHKIEGREGRIAGLNEYYKAQGGILGFRFAAWLLLQDSSIMSMLPMPPTALHGLFLVLITILSTWVSFSIIRIDMTPLVNWSQNPAPLLSSQQFVPPQRNYEQSNLPPKSQPVATQPVAFSIGNLSSDLNQQYEIWQPSTPPEDCDAMEWEPLSSQFQPKPRQQIVKQSQPSPFFGTLPALPAMGVSQSKAVSKPQARQAIGIPPGFFDRPRKQVSGQNSDGFVQSGIAQPTFFPPQDRDADTGLESIFGQVFSLGDEQKQLHQPPQNGQAASRGPAIMFNVPTARADSSVLRTSLAESHLHKSWTPPNLTAAIGAAGLAFGIPTWLADDLLGLSFSVMSKLYISAFATCIAFFQLLLNLSYFPRSSENTTILAFELITLAALTLYRKNYNCDAGSAADKAVLTIISGMIWQEVCYIWLPSETTPKPAEPGQEPVISATAQARPIATDLTYLDSSHTQAPLTSQTPSFGRPRSNSIESNATSMSTTSTTSTAPGWKTPKLSARAGSTSIGPSPGFGLGGLMLDDLGGPSGSNIAGPRNRRPLGAAGGRR